MLDVASDCVEIDKRAYRCQKSNEDGETFNFGLIVQDRKTSQYQVDPEDGYPITETYASMSAAAAALENHHRKILSARIAQRQQRIDEAMAASAEDAENPPSPRLARKRARYQEQLDEARAMLTLLESFQPAST